MQPPRPRSRSTLRTGLRPVAECDPVTALVPRAMALDQLDRQLRRMLPDALGEQVRLASVQPGRIVFLATSAAWASRLRLQQAQILEAARTLGAVATAITVKVAPLPPVPRAPAERKPLSPAAAQHLRAAAKSLSDPDTRNLFLALASLAVSDVPGGK